MKKKRIGCIVLILLALLVAGGGIFSWNAMIDLFQPANSGSTQQVKLIVSQGESTSDIADQLSKEGLIRNALAFKFWAKYKGLDRKLQAGAYEISASMTPDTIINLLLQGVPNAVWVTIPEGKRIFELPQYFAGKGLSSFNAQDFQNIAHTGTFDGSSQYWFLQHTAQGNGPVKDALEGFLFPSTYLIPIDATAADVIKIMLNGFGEQLCPGPSGNIDEYILNQQACIAHARVIDPSTNLTIFDTMQQHNLTLYQTMTIAAIVEREANNHNDRLGSSSVYYNRLQVELGNVIPPDGRGSGLNFFGSDPTVEYALGTPGDPWPILNNTGGNLAQGDPYNTYLNPGLPPGPISGFGLDSLEAAATPPHSNNFYFYAKPDGTLVYASTFTQDQQNIAKYSH